MPVMISRRKGTRHIRIAIKSDGVVRLSVPYGIPEIAARAFLKQKASWINKHHVVSHRLTDGMHIGKHHRLLILNGESSRSHTKITDTEIRVTLSSGAEIDSAKAQSIITKACEKALMKQAEGLLPQRIQLISTRTELPYSAIAIKKLKSRWGSCDSHNRIVLNSYLIQLDWKLIDYVICHELAHTKYHHHQSSFWNLVEKVYPDYKNARRLLKTKQTQVIIG